VAVADEAAVAEYAALAAARAEAAAAARAALTQPAHVLPFLQPGRLVRVLAPAGADAPGGAAAGAPEAGPPADAAAARLASNGEAGTSGGTLPGLEDEGAWAAVVNFERVGSAKAAPGGGGGGGGAARVGGGVHSGRAVVAAPPPTAAAAAAAPTAAAARPGSTSWTCWSTARRTWCRAGGRAGARDEETALCMRSHAVSASGMHAMTESCRRCPNRDAVAALGSRLCTPTLSFPGMQDRIQKHWFRVVSLHH